MKSKTLIIIFAILIVILGITYFVEKQKGDRTLLADLVEADTSAITAIEIYPKSAGKKEIRFEKVGDEWMLVSGDKKFTTDDNSMKAMLREIQELKPSRLASSSEDKWEKYEVTDSLGTFVKMEVDGDVVADLIFGKFDYNQQTQKAASYVRLAGKDKVYAVDGYLSMTFDRDRESFRDRSLILADQLQWTRVTYSYPGDSSFVLQKDEAGYWTTDGMQIDSIACANYLASMARLGGTVFVDEFDPSQNTASHSITFEGENMDVITLDAYLAAPVHGHVLVSSQNPSTVMSGNNGLFDRVFIPKSNLYLNPDAQILLQ